MSGQTKPLYEMERQLEYKRHLQRLESIGKERSKRIAERDSIREMHRLRNHSMHFHTQKQVEYLNQQNEKIINKLMGIAKRKSNSFFTSQPDQPTQISYLQNPARKRTQQQIQRNNIALAERILSQHSEFEIANQKRMIEEYQKTKKRMERNKRVSLPQLEDIARSRSFERMPQRIKEAYSTLEDKQE